LDISPNQVALARQNAPLASLLRGDMVRLPFREDAFDAVAAFYSMTHVPRVEHASLLAGIARVLRPGGCAVLTMGSADNPDGIDEDWLGAPMFFSHFDGDRNVALVREAGFEIVSAEDERELEYGIPVSFRWVVARLPKASG
jgi:SAM-dependent methyltransferase